MATGDLKNNVKQLLQELKTVKYGKRLDTEEIISGCPKAYLPIYNYLFTSYSSKFNKDIVNSNNELYGKSDMRFMEAVYKILRDMFDYKAKITRDQFFAPGFCEHKVIMAREVVVAVRSRYSPPKTTRSHITVARSAGVERAAAADKVLEEPVVFSEMPRKVPKQPVHPTVAAGAIVLPTRMKASSGGAIYKIPKSIHGWPDPKLNERRPVFGEPVQTASSASSSSATGKRWKSRERAPTGDVVPQVIRANGHPDTDDSTPHPGYKSNLPLHTASASSSLPDTKEIEGIVRCKIVDIVSPAMVKLNERIGVLEITLEDLEEKKKEPQRIEPTPSAALITGLTQQMNDVVFKLQTLTSRITLLENRVTMVEAQLHDEENHRMTLFASQNYTNFKKFNPNLAQNTEEIKQSLPFKSTRPGFESCRRSLDKVAESEKAQAHRRSEARENGIFSPRASGDRGESCSGEKHARASETYKDGGQNSAEDQIQGQTGEDDLEKSTEEAPMKTPALAFMKTLVNPEDCNSLLTTSGAEDFTATETEITEGQNENGAAELSVTKPQPLPASSTSLSQLAGIVHHKHRETESPSPPAQKLSTFSKPTVSKSCPPLKQDFSPIRPFSDLSFLGCNQDESASLIFPSAGYAADESSLNDRRSSTPTGLGNELDTSTLDRVSRINRLMQDTQQLLK